jgi:hypothetical protein
VEGSYEDVQPIYAEFSREIPKRAASVRKARPAAPSFVTRAASTLTSSLTADLRAFAYDTVNGTRFLKAVRQKRQLQRDLRMAQSLGLLDVEVCAKHRKALEAVKDVRRLLRR